MNFAIRIFVRIDVTQSLNMGQKVPGNRIATDIERQPPKIVNTERTLGTRIARIPGIIRIVELDMKLALVDTYVSLGHITALRAFLADIPLTILAKKTNMAILIYAKIMKQSADPVGDVLQISMVGV